MMDNMISKLGNMCKTNEEYQFLSHAKSATVLAIIPLGQCYQIPDTGWYQADRASTKQN